MAIFGSDNDTSRIEDGRLATGITVLDDELLRGIPAGSTVAILADPLGMGDLFLAHLAHTDRPTEYISTVRPDRYIEEDLKEIGDLADEVTIEDVYSTPDSPDDIIRKHAGRLKEGGNLIVDTYSNAYNEDNPEQYLQTLRNLYQHVNDNDALAYLYFSNNDPSQMARAEREALQMCDVIFRIDLDTTGDTIDTRLEILKMRGVEFTDEKVKLNVGERVTIDTTRDIA